MNEFVKKLKLQDWLAIIGTVLAFVVLFLLFAPGITAYYQGEYVKITPTYAFVFGGSFYRTYVVNNATTHSEGVLYRLAPSALIAWILLLLSFLASIVGIVFGLKDAKWAKYVVMCCAAATIAAAILLFASRLDAFKSVASNSSMYSAQEMVQVMDGMNFKLSFGFVGTGVFAILSGLAFAGSSVFTLIKKK